MLRNLLSLPKAPRASLNLLSLLASREFRPPCPQQRATNSSFLGRAIPGMGLRARLGHFLIVSTSKVGFFFSSKKGETQCLCRCFPFQQGSGILGALRAVFVFIFHKTSAPCDGRVLEGARENFLQPSADLSPAEATSSEVPSQLRPFWNCCGNGFTVRNSDLPREHPSHPEQTSRAEGEAPPRALGVPSLCKSHREPFVILLVEILLSQSFYLGLFCGFVLTPEVSGASPKKSDSAREVVPCWGFQFP